MGEERYTEIQVSILEDDVAKVVWNARKAKILRNWIKKRKVEQGPHAASYTDISRVVTASGAKCSRGQVQKLAENRATEVYYDVAVAISKYFERSYANLGKVVRQEVSK